MKQVLALLLLLPRERMQGSAYTPSAPGSHARLRVIFGSFPGHRFGRGRFPSLVAGFDFKAFWFCPNLIFGLSIALAIYQRVAPSDFKRGPPLFSGGRMGPVPESWFMSQTLTCDICGRKYTLPSGGFLRGSDRPGSVTICPDCAKPLKAYYWDRLKREPLKSLWGAVVLIVAIAFITWPIWGDLLFSHRTVFTEGCLHDPTGAVVCAPLRSN